jgi:hypothetical protein
MHTTRIYLARAVIYFSAQLALLGIWIMPKLVELID